MEYELLQRYPKAQGEPSLPSGTRIKAVHISGYSGYGHDRTNLFWTTDFITKHPEIFKQVQN